MLLSHIYVHLSNEWACILWNLWFFHSLICIGWCFIMCTNKATDMMAFECRLYIYFSLLAAWYAPLHLCVNSTYWFLHCIQDNEHVYSYFIHLKTMKDVLMSRCLLLSTVTNTDEMISEFDAATHMHSAVYFIFFMTISQTLLRTNIPLLLYHKSAEYSINLQCLSVANA